MNAAQVAALRKRLDLTAAAFAGLVGSDVRSVRRWEAGDVAPGGASLVVMACLVEAVGKGGDAVVDVLRQGAALGGLAPLLGGLLRDAAALAIHVPLEPEEVQVMDHWAHRTRGTHAQLLRGLLEAVVEDERELMMAAAAAGLPGYEAVAEREGIVPGAARGFPGFPDVVVEPDGFVRLPQLELDGHVDEGPESLRVAARREAKEAAAAAEDAELAAGGGVRVGMVEAGSEEEALRALFTPEGG